MHRILFILWVYLPFIACKKKEIEKILDENCDINRATLISQSSFSSNAHSTFGNVKLYSKNGSKNLVFENFKTDGGPDLKVYVSKSTSNTDFIEVGALKFTSGNFFYTIAGSLFLFRKKTINFNF